jgi:hypothetical protein
MTSLVIFSQQSLADIIRRIFVSDADIPVCKDTLGQLCTAQNPLTLLVSCW